MFKNVKNSELNCNELKRRLTRFFITIFHAQNCHSDKLVTKLSQILYIFDNSLVKLSLLTCSCKVG